MPHASLKDYYFVSLQIAIDGGYRYQHFLLVADTFSAFMHGLEAACKITDDMTNGNAKNKIVLAFVQNLESIKSWSPALFEQPNLKLAMHTRYPEKDGEHLSVLGLIEQEIFMTPEQTNAAFASIRHSNFKYAPQLMKNFELLDAWLAHPVRKEFKVLFFTVAQRLLTLLNIDPACAEFIH
jgi:hypothetical protein